MTSPIAQASFWQLPLAERMAKFAEIREQDPFSPAEVVNPLSGASETFYAGVWADTALHWLRQYRPVARVGRSIRLYRIP